MENINLYNSICFTASKINKYRKNSLAQKIRRDLLRLIIYKPKKEAEIKILKKQIEDLTSKKFNNISELILFDFQNNFVNYLNKQNKPKKFKLNPTSKALELIDLFEKINNPFLSIYIHGSHADGYTTNFSDLDVSIFISNQRSTFDFEKIKNDILILNNCVKKFDLESHHSIFLNLTNDLNCYPESIMPLDVLGQSLISKNQKTISAQTRFSIDIAIDTFLRIYSSINKISPESNNNNFYNIKFIISSYFMLIILKYEILNMKFLDKKTIFSEILYQANSNNFLHIFNLCSEIREKWPEQTKTIDFCISNYLIKKIQDHSRSMLNEIDKSFSLKKTINTIMIN